MEKPKYASVVVDVAVPTALDYEIPPNLTVKPGSRIKVPVRGRTYSGTVLALKETSEFASLSLIQEVLPSEASVPLDLLKLGLWISSYYCAPFFKVLKQLLPPPIRKEMEEKRQLFVQPLFSGQKLIDICLKKQGAQREIINVLLLSPKGMLLTELLEKSGATRSSVTTLERQEIILTSMIAIDRNPLADHDFFPTKHKKLGEEQQVAFDQILGSLQSSSFQTHLLFGVTGSGKTEVYLQAIDAALSMGKSALFLVPEIALTSQTVERLRSRFQEKVAILHHRLSPGERRDTWVKIREGRLSLVVGPRSALFCPLENLGLLIIDEEHDGAYKQTDEMPCYQGRDVAVMRGKINNATVILGSATPSLESFFNAEKGKYHLNSLSQRADSATLPTVHVVNMKPEYAKARRFTLFSEKLLDSIKKRVENGEQSLLFLNRRGFHTASVCLACQEKISCPHCSIALTFHKGQNRLACHLCNYETRPLSECPSCKAQDSFKFSGAGTELVERSLHAIFPSIRTLRLDADTTRHKGSHDKLFKQFRSGKADVLIGTQMIAKGLHFPSVTLVGILNPDATLHIPDFRASEMLFQLMTQVAGRSGRAALKGEVILQTALPDHPLYQHAQRLDFPAFYREEVEVRKAFRYPPFCHLIKLIFSGENSTAVQEFASRLREKMVAKLPGSFEIHPIVPCGYAKIKNQFRFQCLIKGDATKPVTEILRGVEQSAKVRMVVDVDPLSTYF